MTKIVSQGLASAGINRRARENDESFRERPTEAELEVARLALSGMRVPQMAERLGKKIKTLEARFERLYTRLGVNTRAEALDVLTARGYFKHPPSDDSGGVGGE